MSLQVYFATAFQALVGPTKPARLSVRYVFSIVFVETKAVCISIKYIYMYIIIGMLPLPVTVASEGL